MDKEVKINKAKMNYFIRNNISNPVLQRFAYKLLTDVNLSYHISPEGVVKNILTFISMSEDFSIMEKNKMPDNSLINKQVRLVLDGIEGLGIGKETRLHKAYNELEQAIANVNIQDINTIQYVDNEVNKCEAIINELIEALGVADISKLLFKLHRKNNIDDDTRVVIKTILNRNHIELGEFISFRNKVNNLIRSLSLQRLLEDSNLLSGAMYNFNKYLDIHLNNPETPLSANLVFINDKIEQLVSTLCNLTDVEGIDQLITKLSSKKQLDLNLRENIKEVLRPPIAKVNVLVETEDNAVNSLDKIDTKHKPTLNSIQDSRNKDNLFNCTLKNLKKLLKVLKRSDLKKDTTLYVIYTGLKEESYSKDLIDRYEYILQELNRITNTSDIDGLIKYLKETVNNRPLNVAYKLHHLLKYNRSVEYITHTSNLKMETTDNLDSYLEAAVNSFRMDLKACLQVIKRNPSIKAIEIISTASVKQIA